MTKSAELRIGQRVRATNRETGDTSEFKVHNTYSGGVNSDEHSFADTRWDFELIPPPIPVEPGLYSLGRNMKFLWLNTYGRWFWVDFTSLDCVSTSALESDVQRHAYRMTQVYSFVES